MSYPIYLDNNATTRMDPRVLEAMIPYFTQHYGNAASRSHSLGWEASEAVEYAREQVAELIGASPKEIVFTSGATESDNLALKGVFESYASRGKHLITVETEHKAVLDTCKHLEKQGAQITYLPVGADGLLDPDDVQKAIRPDTILVSVMWANNETGVIQPVSQIGQIARERGVLFMTDATQAVGKIPVDTSREPIDLLALSGHKIYGPKGVGALFVRRKDPRVQLTAQIDGGGHERGRRSGTLNVPAIVGLGKACQLMKEEGASEGTRLGMLRDRLEGALMEMEEVYVNGHRSHRLAQTTNLSFRDTESEALMLSIQKKIAVSSGSACTSATLEPSYVLRAMGVEEPLARAAIRFGLGRFTTEEEIDFTIQYVRESVIRLRQSSPRWQQRHGGIIPAGN
ncbi:MAG: IscS subfamily cysteine desulfurase [Bacteroidota bacterium]|nr:IscS subfamily cysteine desulfurase [Bacteroidota bacterium]